MTRETKIGLLVGLAFIIVIGILLSDHMTSATEPPKAPLSTAGNNVRESVITPASPQGTSAAVALGAAGQSAVTPSQPVMTGGDLSQPAAPIVQVGPGQPSTISPVVVQQQPPVVVQAPVHTGVQTPAGAGVQAGAPPVFVGPQAVRPSVRHALEQAASRVGEEIVPLGERVAAAQAAARPQPVPMGQLREYKAVSGDSLSRLAARFMGSASKANVEAIVRVNPTLQQNPDRIVEGRTYVIPPMPVPVADATPSAPAAAAPAPAPAAPAAPRETVARASEPQAHRSENFSWYTVKENENLWKIASEHLGSGNAWTQIRDLNQDILKGENQVRSNTRIRIPNKPVASAAH